MKLRRYDQRRPRRARRRRYGRDGLDAEPERYGVAQARASRRPRRVGASDVGRALPAALDVSRARASGRRRDPRARGRVLRRARRLAGRHLSLEPRRISARAVFARGLRAVREAAAVPGARARACCAAHRRRRLATDGACRSSGAAAVFASGVRRFDAARAVVAGREPRPRRRMRTGAELFVVEGSFADEGGTFASGAWLRLPPGAAHSPSTASGCVVYIKEGGFAYLRAG